MTVKNKLSIAYLSRDEFPPQRPDVKILFGQEFQKLGHKVDWYLMARESINKSYEIDYYSGKASVSKRHDKSKLSGRLSNLFIAFAKDFKFIFEKKFKYNILLYKDRFVSAPLVFLACKLKGISCVYWLSYPYHLEYDAVAKESSGLKKILLGIRSYLTKAMLEKLIIPLSDHVFVQSEGMKQLFTGDFPAEKFTAVPMGFDEASAIAIEPHKREQPTIVYLGTLSRIRKIDFIIEAFAKAKVEGLDAKLCLIGGGEVPGDEEIIKSLIKKLGISARKFRLNELCTLL